MYYCYSTEHISIDFFDLHLLQKYILVAFSALVRLYLKTSPLILGDYYL